MGSGSPRWTALTLYYNIYAMSVTRHSHGDAPHAPATVSLSILRLSAWERLAAAAALIVLMWAAVYWAIS
jgi:hypothetical protein